MYSKQRVDQESVNYHTRNMEFQKQKEETEKALELKEQQYMEQNAWSQRKDKVTVKDFKLSY